MELNQKNCKNCLSSKPEDSLVAGYCKGCITKSIALVNDYYDFIDQQRDLNYPALKHIQALHEND